MRALKELRPGTLRFAALPSLAAVLVGAASLYGAVFERPRAAPLGLRDPAEPSIVARLALLPEAMRVPAQRLEPIAARPLALGRVKEPAPAEVEVKKRPWTEPLAGQLRGLLAARMDIADAPMPELLPRKVAVETLPTAAPGRDSPVFGKVEEAPAAPVVPVKIETEQLTVSATGMLRDPAGQDFLLLESRFDESRMIPKGGRYGPFVVEELSQESIRLVDEMGQVIEGPPGAILGRSHQGQRRLTKGRARLSDQLRPERKAAPGPARPVRRQARSRRRGYGSASRRRAARRGFDDDD